MRLKELFMKIYVWLFELIHKPRLIRFFKPRLVWLYRFYSGDQNKIYKFLKEDQEVSDYQLENDLAGINLNDYLIFYERGFKKLCEKRNLNSERTFVLKKGE